MPIEKHCPACGTKVTPGPPFCPTCGKDLTALWAAQAQEPGGVSAQLPAPPVSHGGAQRPWPFSAELLADRLAVGNYLARPAANALLSEATSSGRSFVDLLVERRQMAAEALRDAMTRIFGIPAADPASAEIDPALVAGFPAEHARAGLLLPLHREGDRLLVVVHDPTAAGPIRAVRQALGLTVDLRLATRAELEPVVHRFFTPRLVALLPSGETVDFPVLRDEVRIGRAPGNDLVLPDPAVGTTHAVLLARNGRYEIVDQSSRNGVFLNDARVSGASPLSHGDVVKLGSCTLTFKLPVPEATAQDGGTQILTPDKLPGALALPKLAPPPAPVAAPAPAPMATLVATPAVFAPQPQRVAAPPADADEAGEPEKKKKKKKKKGRSADKQKELIANAGRIMSQVVGAIATVILGLAIAGKLPSCGGTAVAGLGSTRFTETANGQPHNVSGVVQVGEGRFLMCDNNFNSGFVELTLGPDGAKTGELVQRPLAGLERDSLDDLEAMTSAEENGKTWVFATTSLYNDVGKKTGIKQRPASLLRVSSAPDGSLSAETIDGYREWVLQNNPELAAAADKLPDDGGLNVEGLAWDAKRHALLLGVRTPVHAGKPIVVPVRVKDLAGPWDTSNLEMLPPIYLTLGGGQEEQGIRSMEWDPSRGAFLVVVGNSTSGATGSNAPFQLYLWDGGEAGTMTLVKGLTFQERNKKIGQEQMKPEGVTHATLGGRGALVFADDSGGYAVVWDDDPRLQ